MLKKWHEARPFTFGSVFIFFFMVIPILDQAFIYPMMKPKCENQMEQQVKSCDQWITVKDTKHVSTITGRPGGLHRNP